MRNLRLAAGLVSILVVIMGLSAPIQAQTIIEVTPLEYDFGNVVVGDSATSIVTIQNTNGHILTVTNIVLTGDSDPDFSITSSPTLPAHLDWNGTSSADVEITFAPLTHGNKTASLVIVSDDLVNPVITVPLVGLGVDTIIEVTPLEYDFGTETVGESATGVFTIQNINGHFLTIWDVSFTAETEDFVVRYTDVPPIVLSWDVLNTTEVEITFAPQTLGEKTAVLRVTSDDAVNPVIDVLLSGEGVESEPDPEEEIAEILDFIDESVAAETLEGSGNGNSAENRLNALRNMIEAAGDLIEAGDIDGACGQLMAAYKKCDGQPRPPDFVQGEAREDLAAMILQLMADLGCGVEPTSPEYQVLLTSYTDDAGNSWIRIQMVDKLQQPVPLQNYTLTLPDGSILDGTLDENGEASVRVLDPSNIIIDFPNLDPNSWERA